MGIYGRTKVKGAQHVSLNLMGAFLVGLRASGRDSRPGALIHELAHSFANAEDFAYGENIKCLKVKQAVENAETYEYAAEDAFQGPPKPRAH